MPSGAGHYPKVKADLQFEDIKHEAKVSGIDGWAWPIAMTLIRPRLAEKTRN